MSAWKYPTAFSSWGSKEYEAISNIIAGGQYTQWEQVQEFEREFAAFHKMKHGVMCNSGSSANLLIIAALINLGRVKPGDKVLVPAIAWATTYAPLVQYGLDLVIADVDPASWGAFPYDAKLDLADVKLIVGCSVLGAPADLTQWKSMADVIGAVFIEDNCESLGATIEGRLCGTFGLMNSFSFFHSHQISAIEGGMVLTDDDDCAKMLRMLRDHGWSRSIEPPPDFEREYDFRVFGYNVRALELHAAIARVQLRRLPGFIQARRANAMRFRDATIDVQVSRQTRLDDASPFGIAFRLHEPHKRGAVVEALRAAGIDCRMPTGGSFRLHPYGRAWADQQTPHADAIHHSALFVGNPPFDHSAEIDRLASVLREATK